MLTLPGFACFQPSPSPIHTQVKHTLLCKHTPVSDSKPLLRGSLDAPPGPSFSKAQGQEPPTPASLSALSQGSDHRSGPLSQKLTGFSFPHTESGKCSSDREALSEPGTIRSETKRWSGDPAASTAQAQGETRGAAGGGGWFEHLIRESFK